MKINRVQIKNFRNLTDVDIPLERVTAVIGSNNSGKSNFLRAITLPLIAEEISSGSKRLSWMDIGEKCRKDYYDFIEENKEDFIDEQIDLSKFKRIIPEVIVTLSFDVEPGLYHFMKNFLVELENGIFQLQYKFYCVNKEELLKHVISILKTTNGERLSDIRHNLLPIDSFRYSIIIPKKEESVSYETLKALTYNTIAAERDEFSSNHLKLGSKSLINILNNKLTNEDKVKIEQEYESFFEEIKQLTNMEDVLNWQENTEISNAKEFFDRISVLPNMPPMTSLLNSVQLGYDEVSFTTQGLGYRNLILQVVMINSLITASESALSMLTIEEPEAHLSYENQILMGSYLHNTLRDKRNTQIVYSTHSTHFINKLDLKNIIVFNDGAAYSLSEELDQEMLNYLTKNPNLDLFKILFSPKCILVEGISEEMLIKSYLINRDNHIHDIEVISFHKGFTKIMDLWLKLNGNSESRLGIVRDFDDEPNAKDNHERYNQYSNIYVKTTENYTLEDDIVSECDNFGHLKNYFAEEYSWQDIESENELSDKWKKSKAEIMLRFCQDIAFNKLPDIVMPSHIAEIIDWIEGGEHEN